MTTKQIALSAAIALCNLLISCSVYDPDSPSDPIHDPNQLTELDWNKIYPDTVTPPANPLAPPTDNTVSIQGVLGWEEWLHFVCIHTSQNTYQLGRNGQAIRFDEPMLQEFYMGDTLRVTGEVKRVINSEKKDSYYYIDMTEVELVGAYPYRNNN